MPVKLINITKKFKDHLVLDNINLTLPNKGLVVIKGENGSGKSTLLNIVSLMDDKYQGEILFDNQDISKLSSKDKAALRNQDISYCFQKDNLINYLNVEENKNLDFVLERHKFIRNNNERIFTLSQGQKQLCVLNYLLKEGKKIYLLDEVLDALDVDNTHKILEKITELSSKALVIIVSHILELEDIADFVYKIEKGKLYTLKTEKIVNVEVFEKSKNTSKLSFLLFFKSIKNSFSVHLLSIILSFAMCFLMFMSTCLTFQRVSNYLNKDIYNDDLIIVNTDQIYEKDLIEKFHDKIYYSLNMEINENQKHFFGHSIFDKNLEGNYIFINDDFKEEILSHLRIESLDDVNITFDYLHYNFELPIKIDNSLPFNCFYLNQELLNFDENNYFGLESIKNGFWNTSNHCANYFNKKFINPAFISEKAAERVLHVKLPEFIEDDVLYVVNDELYDENNVYFDDLLPRNEYREKQINLQEVFPNGIRVELFDPIDYSYPKLDSAVIVSEKTFQKIASNKSQYHSLLIDARTDKNEIINYLCNKEFYIAGQDRYNDQLFLQKSLGNAFSYKFIFYSMFVLLIVFQIFLTSYINFHYKTSNIVLKKMGMRDYKRYLLNTLPIILDLLIAIIFGYYFASGYVNNSPYLNNFNAHFDVFELIITLVLILIINISSLLFFRKNEKV